MTSHSVIVGGSNAARLLNCPGSYAAILALPPSTDVPSEFAEEGTFGHEVMAAAMRGAAGPNSGILQGLIGVKVYDRVLTQAHVDEMLQPAVDALNTLLAEYGFAYDATNWPHENVEVELRVAFPGIPGAFGTCDLIIRCGDTVFVVDWKFGSGVPVRAVYDHGDSETVNPQLMFYITSALHSAKWLFKGARKLVVAIIQPRTDTPLTHTVVTRRDIKWFTEDLQEAVVKATNRNPPRSKGEWCRFAPCKINCPLWTDAILDLTAIGSPPTRIAPASTPQPYGEYLARAKALVDVFAMFKKEVDDQLHSFLEDGGKVPGWRLKAKAKQRQWVDEDTVDLELRRLGFEDDEIWRSELVTFKAADATAKRRGVKIPDELRVAPPTNETTVAPTDDPAPVIERGDVVEAFRESLKLLTNK